jgi:hypothetical protein
MSDVRRPRSFHMEHAGEWELYALEHGLPELPREIERGQAVPVARWSGPRYGAVLMVFRPDIEDNDGLSDDGDAETEVLPYRRSSSGWEVLRVGRRRLVPPLPARRTDRGSTGGAASWRRQLLVVG